MRVVTEGTSGRIVRNDWEVRTEKTGDWRWQSKLPWKLSNLECASQQKCNWIQCLLHVYLVMFYMDNIAVVSSFMVPKTLESSLFTESNIGREWFEERDRRDLRLDNSKMTWITESPLSTSDREPCFHDVRFSTTCPVCVDDTKEWTLLEADEDMSCLTNVLAWHDES